MDPRRAPQRISNAHLVDKLAYVRGYSWSATTTSRLPAPISLDRMRVLQGNGLGPVQDDPGETTYAQCTRRRDCRQPLATCAATWKGATYQFNPAI
jgi:hypothetical protein